MMNNLVKLLWIALFGCNIALGANLQMFFAPCGNELCVSSSDMSKTRYTAKRVAKETALAASVRAMVVEPTKDISAAYRAKLLHPVFILDGIYLSTDEVFSPYLLFRTACAYRLCSYAHLLSYIRHLAKTCSDDVVHFHCWPKRMDTSEHLLAMRNQVYLPFP